MRITKHQLEILVKEALNPKEITQQELKEIAFVLPALGKAISAAGQAAGKVVSSAAKATANAIASTGKSASDDMKTSDDDQSAEEASMDAKLRKTEEESDRAFAALKI